MIDSSQKELQSEIKMDDIHVDSRGTSYGKEETPSKPDEGNLNVSSQNDNGYKEMPELEESNKPGLLETTDDHFGNKEIPGNQKDLTENVPQKSKVLSLDSYLKEHFHGDAQCKDPVSIAAVPCATGSKVTASDEPLFLAEKHGNFNFNKENQHGPVQCKLDSYARENNIDITKGNPKDSLKVEQGTTNNILSDSSSTPDEPLDGFVFVNQDGTAIGDHGSSPVRLSPTHPLEKNEDSDRFLSLIHI